MNLQAVFFDMGGTIESFRYDRQLRIRNAGLIRACLEKGCIQLDLTDEQLADRITRGVSVYHHWNIASCIELPSAQIWKNYVFQDLPFSEKDLEPVAEELAFLYETHFYERRLNPEVAETLAQIKAWGLKIGCISNVQSRGQVPFNLKKYGIASFFSTIVLSSEYGYRKPDPSIFHYAARLANVPVGACIYVGDKINRDIEGAKRAGFRLAVQIQHIYDDGEQGAGVLPDVKITRMDELLAIVQQEMEKDRQAAAVAAPRALDAIFFDAGDILYYRPQKSKHLKQFLVQHPARPAIDFERQQAGLIDQAYQGQISRFDYYRKLLELYGIQEPTAIEAGVAALELDDRIVEIYPEVPETLCELKKQGYMLGIITDTALSAQLKLSWFEKAGFGNIWDSLIASNEVLVRKPNPEIYRAGLEQLGIPAQRAVFVGHKKTELDGAKAVGMNTIAFHYESKAVADRYIQHFSELVTSPLLSRIHSP